MDRHQTTGCWSGQAWQFMDFNCCKRLDERQQLIVWVAQALVVCQQRRIAIDIVFLTHGLLLIFFFSLTIFVYFWKSLMHILHIVQSLGTLESFFSFFFFIILFFSTSCKRSLDNSFIRHVIKKIHIPKYQFPITEDFLCMCSPFLFSQSHETVKAVIPTKCYTGEHKASLYQNYYLQSNFCH